MIEKKYFVAISSEITTDNETWLQLRLAKASVAVCYGYHPQLHMYVPNFIAGVSGIYLSCTSTSIQ